MWRRHGRRRRSGAKYGAEAEADTDAGADAEADADADAVPNLGTDVAPSAGAGLGSPATHRANCDPRLR